MTTPAAPTDPDDGEDRDEGYPLSLKIFLAVIALVVLAFLVSHLAGGGMRRHF
jgi:hypothetical protein